MVQEKQMNTRQNYLALDLELNHDDNSNPTKIIQVGIAIGSIGDVENIKTYKWYLNPEEPIKPFITQLTGITDQDIEQYSISHQQVATDIQNLVQEYQTFPNPVQWGMGDSAELKAEFKQRNIDFPCFGHRELDVKTMFTYLQTAQGRNVKGGLSSCMGRYKLHFKGEAHRADVDAYNTLIFFFELVKRQYNLEMLVQDSRKIIT